MSAGPETLVPAPPLLPPTSGLLQVAQVIEHDASPNPETRDHWLAGIRWTVPNSQGVSLATVCYGGTGLPQGFSGSPAGAAYPFAVIAEDTCLSASFREAEFQQRARDSIAAREQAAVEAEFERGALTAALANPNPRLAEATTGHVYLGSPANTQAGQLALSPKDALAALDEAIAYWGGGLGMIHAPAYVIAQWVASRAVVIEDFDDSTVPVDPKRRLIFSPNGNPIIAGQGYRGASPDLAVVPTLLTGGHAAMWCYATDMVTVHRDDRISLIPDNTSQALDRTNNYVTWRAWRAYAIAWSRLLHASVKVNTVLAAAP